MFKLINKRDYISASRQFDNEVQLLTNDTDHTSIEELLYIYTDPDKPSPQLLIPSGSIKEEFTVELWFAFKELVNANFSIIGIADAQLNKGFSIAGRMNVSKAIIRCILNKEEIKVKNTTCGDSDLCHNVNSINVWYHIACSRSNNNFGKQIVNHEKKIITLDPVSSIKDLFSSNKFVLGGNHDKWFSGYIRELRIWSKALSVDEITFRRNLALNPLEYKHLIAYWPLTDRRLNHFFEISRHSVIDVGMDNPATASIYGRSSHQWVYDVKLWTLAICREGYFFNPISNSCSAIRRNIGLYIKNEVNIKINEEITTKELTIAGWIYHTETKGIIIGIKDIVKIYFALNKKLSIKVGTSIAKLKYTPSLCHWIYYSLIIDIPKKLIFFNEKKINRVRSIFPLTVVVEFEMNWLTLGKGFAREVKVWNKALRKEEVIYEKYQ